MSKRKPRIIVTVVSEEGTCTFSTVRGRKTADGGLSDGPTKEQYNIANKAILDLIRSK